MLHSWLHRGVRTVWVVPPRVGHKAFKARVWFATRHQSFPLYSGTCNWSGRKHKVSLPREMLQKCFICTTVPTSELGLSSCSSAPAVCAPTQIICLWAGQNGEAGEKLFSTSLQIPGVSVWLVIHATHQRDTQAHEGWISSDSLLSVGLGLEQLHKGELRDGIVWTLSKSD